MLYLLCFGYLEFVYKVDFFINEFYGKGLDSHVAGVRMFADKAFEDSESGVYCFNRAFPNRE